MEIDVYSQNILLSNSKFSEEKNYWLDKLSGNFRWGGIPVDYPGYFPPDDNREFIRATFPVNISREILRIVNQSPYGLYIFLLAGTAGLLNRYSPTNAYSYVTGEETDIAVGMPAFQQTADVPGNSQISALRITINGSTRFKDLLLQLKDTVGEAKKFRNIPFTKIAQLLNLAPAEGDSPLFKTIVLLENIHVKEDVANAHADTVFSFLLLEEQIQLRLEYNPGLFSYQKIKQLLAHLVNIFQGVVANPMSRFCDIEMLTQAEKCRLLEEFNGVQTPYPGDKSIYELFEDQVERNPDYNIVVGPSAGKNHQLPIQITYGELNNRSNCIAGALRAKEIKDGTIVGIMLEPCVEMVLSIVGILKAGCVFLPIEPGSPAERINYVLGDGKVRILLSRPHLSGILIEVINIEDRSIYSGKSENKKNTTGPGDPVYVIYTSGTTGRPKGVLIRNSNLVNYVNWFSQTIGLNAGDKAILTSSFAFDALYTQLFSSLLTGCQLHVVARETFLSAELLINYLRDNEITYIKNTPSLFNLVVNSQWFSPEMLRRLRFVMLGGEEINIKDVEKAHHLCPHLRVMNHYGPTETTIGSIARFIDFNNFEEYKETPTIGKPLYNTQVYILDKEFNIVPQGVVGGLFIGGAGVGMGYLNKPELTCERFIRGLLGRPDGLYCTGDLARWTPGGDIQYLGRADDQVKIRGYRIELAEIESRLLKYPGIRDVVVLVREEKIGDKYLCAYIVCDKGLSIPGLSLREWLSQGLPGYMIPSYFVQLEKIPLTPHAKLDRRALPKPEVKATADYVGPRNEVEEKLVGLWSEVLEIDRDVISIDSNFFQMGGQSLKATILAARIHKELHLKLPLAEFFKTPTIRGLSNYISGMEEESYESIAPVEKRAYYEVSSAQRRLYILQQMELESIAYNMPGIIPLPFEVDLGRIEAALKKLLTRHESMRTSFHMIADQPVQVIRETGEVECKIECYELGSAGVNFIRPFDLSQAPLLRMGLVSAGEGKRYLLVDMHHIITDGISRQVLRNDFILFYKGEELPPLRIQYKDFAQWQNRGKERDRIRGQELYWLREFEEEANASNLPLDYLRPVVQSFEGSNIDFEITGVESEALKTMTLTESATLFMIMLGMFNILLCKLSGQDDIVVGTPTAGRRHADLEKIIGMFVNTLPLRNYPGEEKTFKEFLAELRARTVEAFENQEYPFEELVEKLSLNRDMGRNPLFDVMFSLLSINSSTAEEIPVENSTGSWKELDEAGTGISKFDLSLNVVESVESGRLQLSFEYCTQLFKEKTIERFIAYFKKIISTIVREPGIKISEIEIISAEEKTQILYDFNNTEVEYPQDKTIHELFAEQASKTPDRIALVGAAPRVCPRLVSPVRPVSLTYARLNEQANRLAGLLIEKGVLANDIVGITMERSVEMIAGIMGILKSGGAYLPIDPDYPKERIAYMLKDSNARILINKSEANLNVQNSNDQNKNDAIPFVSDSEHLNFEFVSDFGFRISDLNPSNLAYIIYTSGSTGEPKGVMVEHRNVSGYVNAFYREFEITASDIIIQQASFAFDVFVEEVYPVLFKGGKIAIPSKNETLDSTLLSKFIVKNNVTIISCSPLHLDLLNKVDGIKTIHTFIAGGDVLKGEYVDKLLEIGKVYNTYGPSETTVCATYYRCITSSMKSIPIGKPIANYKVFILDKGNKFIPIGVPGELCVSGVGVTRGYLNRPELTAEKFIHFHQSSPIIHHSKLYRTGDLARWLADPAAQEAGGYIVEFLGRIDHQVKIRGFRVELGEIEKQLLNIEGIKEAVASVREEEGADKYICAYIVSDKEYGVSELREYLSRGLPGYMIPSYFVPLEKIPLTANGKLDLRALPKPGLKVGRGYIAPGNETEEKLVEIWANVLNIEKGLISIDSSFFELGGHSLKAIQLLSVLQKDFEVSLADIFQHQTILSLAAALLNKKVTLQQKIEELKRRVAQNIDEQELQKTQEEFEPLERAYLDKIEKYRTIELSKRIIYRSILLTGATGYLGIHILEELLRSSNADIYLLIRGNDPGEVEQRLLGKLKFYFDEDLYDMYRWRIHILNGDIARDRFGLSGEDYDQLSGEIDCIISSAALVKHFGPYKDFLQINVEGVGRLIEFAFAGRKKDLKHISTISVGSGEIKGKEFSLFTEFDHDIGQNVSSYYLQTKLKGEQLIEEARARGLNASIFRVGNLVFQSGTGKFQENIEDNAFYNLLKSFVKIGITIESDEAELDFSFIDQTGKAFGLLYDRESLLGETHHLFNSNKVCPNEFAGMMREIGESLRTVTVAEFLDILQNNYENPSIRNYIERLVSHTVMFSSSKGHATNFKTVSGKTELILNRLGYQWPKLNKKHVAKMFSYCKEVGFI